MSTPNLAFTPGTPQTFKSVVKSGKTDTPNAKDKPKGPDKPLMPYMRFTKQVWDQVRDQYPHMKVWEISKVIGSMWKTLDDKEKQVYTDAFEVDKLKYDEALKIYQQSPAYLNWLAQTKAAALNKENESSMDGIKTQTTPQPPLMQMAKKDKKYLTSPQKQDGKVGIQLSEFDFNEDDDYYSTKHLAAARFYRNHKLMYEVLNDTNLPDPRQQINKDRLIMLRNHIESLSSHTKKIEAEIERDVARFEARKRELLESSERFHQEYNQLVKKLATTFAEAKAEADAAEANKPSTLSSTPMESN